MLGILQLKLQSHGSDTPRVKGQNLSVTRNKSVALWFGDQLQIAAVNTLIGGSLSPTNCSPTQIACSLRQIGLSLQIVGVEFIVEL